MARQFRLSTGSASSLCERYNGVDWVTLGALDQESMRGASDGTIDVSATFASRDEDELGSAEALSQCGDRQAPMVAVATVEQPIPEKELPLEAASYAPGACCDAEPEEEEGPQQRSQASTPLRPAPLFEMPPGADVRCRMGFGGSARCRAAAPPLVRLPACLASWTADHVAQWARSTPMPLRAAELLEEHGVNGPVLESLTEQDLAGLGFARFGWRRQFFLSRQELVARLRFLRSACAAARGGAPSFRSASWAPPRAVRAAVRACRGHGPQPAPQAACRVAAVAEKPRCMALGAPVPVAGVSSGFPPPLPSARAPRPTGAVGLAMSPPRGDLGASAARRPSLSASKEPRRCLLSGAPTPARARVWRARSPSAEVQVLTTGAQAASAAPAAPQAAAPPAPPAAPWATSGPTLLVCSPERVRSPGCDASSLRFAVRERGVPVPVVVAGFSSPGAGPGLAVRALEPCLTARALEPSLTASGNSGCFAWPRR